MKKTLLILTALASLTIANARAALTDAEIKEAREAGQSAACAVAFLPKKVTPTEAIIMASNAIAMTGTYVLEMGTDNEHKESAQEFQYIARVEYEKTVKILVENPPLWETPETPADNSSQQLSEQGYKISPDIWAIHRMDGTIYRSGYGSIGEISATESGSKFNIFDLRKDVRGYILRNGDQYDFYSEVGDRIGRILPCRWDGDGNGWDIFTTTQGYIGHIDRQGDWILGPDCSLMHDLNTLHDYYIKNTRKFELPEEWPAGDGFSHPIGKGP